MLLAHAADLHLGRFSRVSERRQDFLDAFGELVEKVLERSPDALVIAGDLFEKTQPPARELLEAFRGVSRLVSEGIEVILIAGNHDRVSYLASDISPVELLQEVGARVLKWGEWVEVKGVRFLGGTNTPNRALLLRLLDEAPRKAAEPSVLVLHQGLNPYFPDAELSPSELPEAFSYVALGHYHKPRDEGRWAYPGSTEYYDIREAGDPKGFYLLDPERPEKKEFVQLERVRPHLLIEAKWEELEAKLVQVCPEDYPKPPVLVIRVREAPEGVSNESVEEILHDLGLMERILTYEPKIEFAESGDDEPLVVVQEDPIAEALGNNELLFGLASAMRAAGLEAEEERREEVKNLMADRGDQFLEERLRNEAPES